jgi:hypothetical protein
MTPFTLGATHYLWSSKHVSFSVDEPLAVSNFPSSFQVHPGENKTLDITITNSATVNYSVVLIFSLNDTMYQESYVTFSNHTYTVIPNTNSLQAWMVVAKKAPQAALELTVNFYRE